MNKIFIIVVLASIIGGCAWLTQARQDYNTGKTTPLIANEVSPSDQAKAISNTVASLPIPYAAPISVAIGFIGTVFFTWKRGMAIRNNGGAPVATTPNIMNNGALQDIASIFSGMFTTASNTAPTIVGSVWQRVWKTALATIAAGVGTAATIPSVAVFLTGHPIIDGIFIAASSGIAGIEKALSNVPVAAVPLKTTTA